MGYEVEIKAKNELLNKRFNDKDTLAVINAITCLVFDSANKAEYDKNKALGNNDERTAKIHDDYKELMLEYGSELSDQYNKLK